MGSYISIGFVYEKKKAEVIIEKIEKTLEFINIKNEDIKSIKYCIDDFTEVEYKINLEELKYQKKRNIKKNNRIFLWRNRIFCKYF